MRVGILVPDFSGKAFIFSPLSIIFAVGFAIFAVAFIMLKYVLSIPTLVKVFIMNGCWTLSNAFSASILTFLLLMWCMTLMDLCMFNHPC